VNQRRKTGNNATEMTTLLWSHSKCGQLPSRSPEYPLR